MTSILIFAAGAALLVYSAEKLIVYLVGAASGLHISVFLLAIIFTGIEFDDVTYGVVLNIEDLGQVALGTVFGTAIAMTGIVLALTAIVVAEQGEHPPQLHRAVRRVAAGGDPVHPGRTADDRRWRAAPAPVRRVHRLRRRQGAPEHHAGLVVRNAEILT